jgi:hypothetical protein
MACKQLAPYPTQVGYVKYCECKPHPAGCALTLSGPHPRSRETIRSGIVDMQTQMPAFAPTIPAGSSETPRFGTKKTARYLDLEPKILLRKGEKGPDSRGPLGEWTRKT